jgi:hypothetical protein
MLVTGGTLSDEQIEFHTGFRKAGIEVKIVIGSAGYRADGAAPIVIDLIRMAPIFFVGLVIGPVFISDGILATIHRLIRSSLGMRFGFLRLAFTRPLRFPAVPKRKARSLARRSAKSSSGGH